MFKRIKDTKIGQGTHPRPRKRSRKARPIEPEESVSAVPPLEKMFLRAVGQVFFLTVRPDK